MILKKIKEFSGHSAGIYSLAYDGQFIYSGSADKFVTRWNIETGIQDKFAIKFDFPVYSICLANSNSLLFVGLASGDLHVFDLVSRTELKYFTQHKKALFSIAQNPVKKQVYTADSDGNIAVWSSQDLELLLYLPLDCGKVRRILCDDKGDYVALVCQDGTVRIFDTLHFNEINNFKAHANGVSAACFVPGSSNLLLTAGKDAWLRAWDWKNEGLKFEVPAHNYVIYDIVSLDHGKKFVTASRDKTIKLWSMESFSFLQRLDQRSGGHRHSVNCLIKLDERTIVSGSDDKRIILWQDFQD